MAQGIELVSFSDKTKTVTTTNKTGTVVRLMTAKEFKQANHVKGQEARRKYNDYLREHGKASTAGLAAELTKGNLLVRSFRDSRGSMAVSFIKADKLKDPKTDEQAKAKAEADKAVEAAKLEVVKNMVATGGFTEEYAREVVFGKPAAPKDGVTINV